MCWRRAKTTEAIRTTIANKILAAHKFGCSYFLLSLIIFNVVFSTFRPYCNPHYPLTFNIVIICVFSTYTSLSIILSLSFISPPLRACASAYVCVYAYVRLCVRVYVCVICVLLSQHRVSVRPWMVSRCPALGLFGTLLWGSAARNWPLRKQRSKCFLTR